MESSLLRYALHYRRDWCSTPCGINGILTASAARASPALSSCSTPCGINGILTNALSHPFTVPTQCSTPCGINGILTLAVTQPNRHLLCSTPCGINGILTLVEIITHIDGQACSTPCGINGILTPRAQPLGTRRQVLNALRHQWNPHTRDEAGNLQRLYPYNADFGHIFNQN